MNNQLQLGRLAEVISRPDTLLFVGSGVSVWSDLPNWQQLLQQLCEFLKRKGKSAELVEREIANNDLLLAASFGFDRLTSAERCSFLNEVFTSPQPVPSELHRAIVRLGSRCYITTNYGQLLESTIRDERKQEYFNVVTPSHKLEIAAIIQSSAKGFIFKPHGDIGNCETVTITREDYRRLHGERSNVLESMRTLLVSRPVVYIGFGLRDPDFLLVRDLATSVFGTFPPDHYAIIPDVSVHESDYWSRNHGIELVSYKSDASKQGKERHKPLLDLINRVAPNKRLDHPATYTDRNARLLALARYARRLRSAMPETDNIIPMRFSPSRESGHVPSSEISRFLRLNPITAVTQATFSLIIEGSPGSGKSFTIERAALALAQVLEDDCLSESSSQPSELRVPVLVRLRDYSGSLMALIDESLPSGIALADVRELGEAILFLDGMNEIPTRYDATAILEEVHHIGEESRIVITTRFSEEMNTLGLPTVALDEVSRQYVEGALAERGYSVASLNSEVVRLLRKPLFFGMWLAGDLVPEATGIHGWYQQIIANFDKATRGRFAGIDFTEIFGNLAHSMIVSGDLAISPRDLNSHLSAGLPSDVDPVEFMNFHISSGLLVPTPNRRVAFFHHSVTEYFAASYLARLVEIDQGVVRRSLSSIAFDHTVLLSLGFLDDAKADDVFDDVLRADLTLAMRALNYIEAQRTIWVDRALRAVENMQTLNDLAINIEMALKRLDVEHANSETLARIMSRGGLVGGVAGGLLWSVAPEYRADLLDSIFDVSKGYNFVSRLGEAIAGEGNQSTAREVLVRLRSVTLSAEMASDLRKGEELSDYVGLKTACADIIGCLPVGERVQAAAGAPILLRQVVADSLDHSQNRDALRYVQQLIIEGEDYAIVHLYFQMEYGEPEPLSPPELVSGIERSLMRAISEGRQASWAFGALQRLYQRFPSLELFADVDGTRKSRLLPALIMYIRDDKDGFFRALSEIDVEDLALAIEPIDVFSHLEVPWNDYPDLFFRLMQTRSGELAKVLIEGLRLDSTRREDAKFHLADVEWWLEWLDDAHRGGDWFLADRLGIFLALGCDEETLGLLKVMFGAQEKYRSALAHRCLRRMPGLSSDDLDSGSVEWLLNDLIFTSASDAWEAHPLGAIASESLVDLRLIPLMIESSLREQRDNLARVLREAGYRHGRRYVNDRGDLVG